MPGALWGAKRAWVFQRVVGRRSPEGARISGTNGLGRIPPLAWAHLPPCASESPFWVPVPVFGLHPPFRAPFDLGPIAIGSRRTPGARPPPSGRALRSRRELSRTQVPRSDFPTRNPGGSCSTIWLAGCPGGADQGVETFPSALPPASFPTSPFPRHPSQKGPCPKRPFPKAPAPRDSLPWPPFP